ncbi:MAG TPA: sugar transferase [Campylobacterales bacterium]|nr:sugar transferase [Campylobacterales bacterium]
MLFKQTRVGKDEKRFTCYKFRSMHENSHFDPYTQDKDKRVFPYGNFMRKSRIDEIPQLWNILKGDMHLIGPRAEWDILVEEYEQKIPHYHNRHAVRPGITGLAQVRYPYGRNITDTKNKLKYDMFYIQNWSFWLELKIIWMTVMVVLGRRGLTTVK